MNNVSEAPFAGSVTAALFLRRFVKQARRFAHFDIYGWRPAPKPLGPKGGEPQAARAVFEVLRAAQARDEPRAATVTTPPSIHAAIAYRDDLAAETLRGRVAAPRYVAGRAAPGRALRHAAARPPRRARQLDHARRCSASSSPSTSERDGWAWVQLAARRLRRLPALGRALRAGAAADAPGEGARHLSLPRARHQSRRPGCTLSINASLAVAEMGQTFARLADGSFVPARHIAELDRFAPDFVAVAERFVGVPYLWGGKTRLGVDCSGLVQVAHAGRRHRLPARQRHAAGRARRRGAGQRAISTACSAAIWCSGRATSAS